MEKAFKCFLMFVFTSHILSCNNSTETNKSNNLVKRYVKLEKASWLIGEWQNLANKGNYSEVWERKSDSTYFGKSYFVIGKDTISSETINLEQNGNQLFYIPTVKNQNAGQPVTFKLTSSSTNQLIFENPEHDFPQKISYLKISNDSLVAEISGIMDGNPYSEKFPMKRKK